MNDELRKLYLETMAQLTPPPDACPDCYGLGWIRDHEATAKWFRDYEGGYSPPAPTVCAVCKGTGKQSA